MATVEVRFTSAVSPAVMRGGWTQRRDERFAQLIEIGALAPGDTLVSPDAASPITAIVTDDYGLSINGIRQESPDLAAQTASDGAEHDGWSYWTLMRDGQAIATLQGLRAI